MSREFTERDALRFLGWTLATGLPIFLRFLVWVKL
jgi:hypothetical protein